MRCGVGADIPPPDPPTTTAAHHLGHELRTRAPGRAPGQAEHVDVHMQNGRPVPLSSDAVLASIAVGYPIGSTNVEPRKGYETLQSIHGTELKHPNQGENVRECFVNSLDPFGATLTSFTFGAPKALPRGARLRSRRERKAPPSSIHCSTKSSAKGIALGGMRS